MTSSLLTSRYCSIVLQVSSGAIEEAKTDLDQMLRLCARPLTPEEAKDDDLQAAQTKSMHDVVHELVKQVTSPNKLVREEVCTNGCQPLEHC